MLLGRALLGVGIGMGFVVFPTYMAEVAPADVRGALVTCQEVAQCIGCLAAYAVTYMINPADHWRMLLLVAGAPAVVQLFGTLILPESPRWLVTKKKVRKARLALEKIAGERPFCGKSVEPQEENGSHFVDTWLAASPSAMSGSDLSRLSRVRATRMLLEEADEHGRRLSEIENLDAELKSAALTIGSRSASRTSLVMDEVDMGSQANLTSAATPPAPEEPTEAFHPTHHKKQPPLKMLLDLMEEQELREEAQQRRHEEAVRRYEEEMAAAAGEGRLSWTTKFLWRLKRTFNMNNFPTFRKLINNKTALLIAVGCAASQNFTGANTILYYSVDLMRAGGICDPLFTGVMIGVVKVR
eukprot:Blabericola_migrator_1__3409@NODE_1_length_33786_cov_123_788665_g0_i0_p9_GENE_NODE_1_length_33786_cov_123_788665_g0_i0NODE_1_length_33786_cov_123_788665_g0_i0_p9_ORF_typecomplete_len356_score68_25Sugar_tr/PF00083_24/1_6e34Sugar_tr/PF00083_24/3_2e07MFS_1/PF07690_16/1_6e11PUCC/PF03209_15/0_0014TRI12/PF06609_13/0_0021TauE/PF01925_19/0_14DUF3682/PF12446_8/0_094_NODE_1_length_33786_cov_123_788665_g0_i03067331740